MSDASGVDRDRLRPARLRHLTLGVLAGYAAAVLLVVVLALLGFEVLSAIQSYTRGESLWSKAQKEAVFALDEYAVQGEERYWDRYMDALAVTLGDRQARVELARPDPDLEKIRSGFLQGGLHAHEVDGMIRLYRWFGDWEPMRRAIEIWSRGDSLIAELHRQAAVIRLEFESAPADTARVFRAMERVDALNGELHRAELAFTEAMNDGDRLARRRVLLAIGGLSVLLLLGGAGLSGLLYRVIHGRESALRRAERRYRRIFEGSQDAIFVTDVDGAIREMNPAGRELFGYGAGEISEMRAQDFYHDPSERERYREQVAEKGGVEGFEVKLETKDGRVLDCEVTSTPRTGGGKVIGYQGIIRDVTERKRFEEELERRALHDFLTGLPNRALLWDRLEHAVARCARAEQPLAVLFVDLDRFKVINDSLGHDAGDQVLLEVARRLGTSVRAPDTVARVGGDEFVLLLEELEDPEEAEVVAGRIRQAFEPPFRASGEEVHLDASIGVAFLTPEEAGPGSATESVEEVIRRADGAMYRAKAERGTRVARFTPEAEADREPRIQRENELRRAIEAEEFVLHYQPIVSLPDEKVTAVEPVVRWDHPERGLLAPREFLPLAEETGLILELGTWVLEAACRQGAGWNASLRAHDPLFLHPNLSALQFEDPKLTERLERILEATGFRARHLELEVTEHSLLQAPVRTRKLADIGVGLCIDDFGTGYSSLTYVRTLTADTLKVDLSFVHGIGESQADEAIIRTILTLGRSLGMDVVAEGVETELQRDWLVKESCGRAQGFLFGRPAPADAFRSRLEEEMQLQR